MANINEIISDQNNERPSELTNNLQSVNELTTKTNMASTISNRKMCELLNLHLKRFYNYIYIPSKIFRKNKWNIDKILYDNEDVLFYNTKFIPSSDEERFYEVYDKFISMLGEILDPTNKLYEFLERCSDNKSPVYLKRLLTGRKYKYINPSYIVGTYVKMKGLYKDDIDQIKSNIEKHLDEIIDKIEIETKEFQSEYDEILKSYVYEYPSDINIEDKNLYILGFINSVIISILNFAEKLIDLNVYAVHAIIVQLTENDIPLEEIVADTEKIRIV